MKKALNKLIGSKPAPRDLATIKAELSEVTFQLGNAEYNLYAYGEEKARLVKRSRELNLEGKERIELDKVVTDQKAAEQAKTALSTGDQQ